MKMLNTYNEVTPVEMWLVSVVLITFAVSLIVALIL
jgi:hypothetical protein